MEMHLERVEILLLIAALVSWAHQHVLVWGGLRGALALALALGLPPTIPFRGEILTVAFAVVAFSVVVQGLTVTPLMKKLGLMGGTNVNRGDE